MDTRPSQDLEAPYIPVFRPLFATPAITKIASFALDHEILQEVMFPTFNESRYIQPLFRLFFAVFLLILLLGEFQ